jgi:hypothetical protein
MKNIHAHAILSLIGVIAFAATVILYIYTQYSIHAAVRRAVAGRSGILIEQGEINQKKSLAEIYSATLENRGKISDLFISANDAVSFIESVENLGLRAGSAASLSAVSTDEAAGPFTKIKAHLEASGSWSEIMKTLLLAETLPFQASLSNARLNESGLDEKEKNGRNWHLSFDIASNMISEKSATSTGEK